jgi:hypothetical protein
MSFVYDRGLQLVPEMSAELPSRSIFRGVNTTVTYGTCEVVKHGDVNGYLVHHHINAGKQAVSGECARPPTPPAPAPDPGGGGRGWPPAPHWYQGLV